MGEHKIEKPNQNQIKWYNLTIFETDGAVFLLTNKVVVWFLFHRITESLLTKQSSNHSHQHIPNQSYLLMRWKSFAIML